MPQVRGRFVPQIESAGRPKRTLDVVLWGNEWNEKSRRDLDEIEVLREYLRSIQSGCCSISFLVPATHTKTIQALNELNLSFTPALVAEATAEILAVTGAKELANAVETAVRHDADALVVTNLEWLAFAQDIDALGLFLTETSFLKYYCEIFVRGHDVPWAFQLPIWDKPWNGFYQMAERSTFKLGLDFLHKASKKGLNRDAQETGRSLIHNRLPNICFTRDRLLFYDTQKMAAHRANWKRQEFAFELSYYLNFYYPLIFGGFDHIALLVSQTLNLGLPEKSVGATYQSFLEALKAKSATLHATFTQPTQVEFMKRIAYLRHYASHRGSLAPGKLIERPERELSDEQVDAMIVEAGMDDLLEFFPEGEMKREFREILRYNFRMAEYERTGNPVEGVVPLVIDGNVGFIRPVVDTSWNFQNFRLFTNRVLSELIQII